MEYKYFTQEIVETVLDISLPPSEASEIIKAHIEKICDGKTQEEMKAVAAEATHLAKRLHRKIQRSGKEAKARQNKMNRMFVDQMVKGKKEEFMLILTTCNNVAYIVMKDALDLVKAMPEYKQKFSQIRQAFNHAEDTWEAYERGLRCSDEHWIDPRHFSDEEKKRYKEGITMEDFYEYWQGIGSKAYQQVKDEVNVLRNKFKLAIEAHGLPHPKESAYVLATASIFMLCDTIFEGCCRRFSSNNTISKQTAYNRLKDFSLGRMMLAWGKCVKTMGKETMLDQHESRNVELTLEQLCDRYNEYNFYYRSMIANAEDYPEIFRTKGEQKKYLRELNDKLE